MCVCARAFTVYTSTPGSKVSCVLRLISYKVETGCAELGIVGLRITRYSAGIKTGSADSISLCHRAPLPPRQLLHSCCCAHVDEETRKPSQAAFCLVPPSSELLVCVALQNPLTQPCAPWTPLPRFNRLLKTVRSGEEPDTEEQCDLHSGKRWG